jgi:hypothetical protein
MANRDPDIDGAWVRIGVGWVEEVHLGSDFADQGVGLADADLECEHGRLGGDPTPACGCWMTEQRREPQIQTPDLLDVLTKKETEVTTDVTELAPYGRKADGTPRKRPAPSPEQLEAAKAGRQRAAATRNGSTVARLSTPAGREDLITRMIGELDGEIERLTTARDALRKVAA